jgi:phosphoribosylformimino-5-aminoimidazole carboxamide ribotide isomerase
MQLIPAVDLVGDSATRLERGDFDRALFATPFEEYIERVVATQPVMLHLVDLDGARHGGVRPDVVARCLRAAGDVPVQVSGGIRNVDSAKRIMDLGAARILVGTAAFGDPAFLDALVAEFADQVGVTLDVRGGTLRVAGWLDSAAMTVAAGLRYCVDHGVTRILGTAIDRDGTGNGPDLELMSELCASPLKVIAAGGVRNRDDVAALAEIGCEAAVTGRAFFEELSAGRTF